MPQIVVSFPAWPRVCLATTLLLSLPAVARAQCLVEGTVVSAAGAPLAGATVQLRPGNGGVPIATTTDLDGRYRFDDVKPGIWAEIRVVSAGRPLARTFTLVSKAVETIDIRTPAESSAPASADDLDPLGGEAGEIRGVVRSSDGLPVGGALVSIDGTPVSTTTDSAGRYSFGRLRAQLSIEVRASAAGYAPAGREVAVPADGVTDLDFTLDEVRRADDSPADLGVASRVADTSTVALRAELVTGLPSLSRHDVVRAAQFVPGVIASLESSELFVRGASPDQTRIIRDGFTWYPFSRLFAGLSPFNGESLRETAFTPDTFGAEDGGRLSSALSANNRARHGGKPIVSADVSAFGWATSASLPFGDRGALLIAGRRSLPASLYGAVLDRFTGTEASAARSRSPRHSGGAFAAPPQPSFSDLDATLELRPGRTNRLAFTVYDAHDDTNLSRDVPLPERFTDLSVPGDIDLPLDALVQVGDVQSWKGRGMSAVWHRLWSPTVATTASIARSRFSKDHDQAFFLTSPSTREDYAWAAGRAGSSGLTESNVIRDTTARIESAIRIGFDHALEIGGEVVSLDTAYVGSAEVLRRARNGTPSSALAPFLDERGTGTVTTVFAQDRWRPVARLVVSPGLRVARYDRADRIFFEPRVSASYAVGPGVHVNAGWAVDHQFANRLTREDREHGDGDFWALSDGATIPVARAQQIAAGATVEAPGLLFHTQLYHRRLMDMTLVAPRLLPGEAAPADGRFFHIGSGTSTGMGFSVQQRWDRNSIWAGYTVGRVEYRYPTLEPDAFPASHDQRHQVTIADTIRLRSGWSVSAAWVAASGRPVTPAQEVGAIWFPSGELAYQPLFGPKNSARLSPYHRLDLSTQIVRRLRGLTSTLGVTVFNIYDRENISFSRFEAVGTSLAVSVVPMTSRAATAFFRVSFQ